MSPQIDQRISEAQWILAELGFPRAQRNERSALTLLALLDLRPEEPWTAADMPLRGITEMMSFMRERHDKDYAPNTRETVRRQTIHQFRAAGLATKNPDDPGRPTNSGKTVYQINSLAWTLAKSYVTAFTDRAAFRPYIADIARETEVRVANSPDHLIHFDGSKFLGPSD